MCQETRPDWDELCDCAGISLTESQQGHYDWLGTPELRKDMLRAAYNRGADYTIYADCPACHGLGRTGVQRAA